MKWLRSLLRKPAKPVEPTSAAKATPVAAKPAPAPAASPDECRRKLAAATLAEDRSRLETELGRALAAAGQGPAADDPVGVCIAAVNAGGDRPKALAWLERLAGDDALALVAMNARYAEVRLAAAKRLANDGALERVAESARERDKGLYRYCSDTLRARRKAAAEAAQAERLLADLNQLVQATPLPPARLAELEKQARNLAPGGDIGEECTRLLAAARARVQTEAEAQRGLMQLAGRADALEALLGGDRMPDCTQIDAWVQDLESIRAALGGAPSWLAGQPGAAGAGAAVARIEARLTALGQDAERALACQRFLDGVTEIDFSVDTAWEELEKPQSAAEREALEHRWSVLRHARLNPPAPQPQAADAAPEPATAAVPEPSAEGSDLPPPDAAQLPAADAAQPPAADPAQPPAPESVVQTDAAPAAEAARPAKLAVPKRKIDLALIEPLIDKLEAALEAGQLHEAEPLEKEIAAKVGDAGLPGALGRRIGRAHSQIARLRSWARWGTDQAREHLCEAAEGLLAQPHADLEDLGQHIAGLRTEWKRLDAHGHSPRALWERFDGALEKAYVPVGEFRAAEARRHEEIRLAKEALLGEFEASLAAQVWEMADWRVIEAQRGEMFKRWREAPLAGFRDERALRKRLDGIVAQIDARLEAARKIEIERREQLIAAVDALKDQPDLGRAITEARKLQDRWRDEVTAAHLQRSDEQALWKRFRAGCDAVFARRDAQRAEQEAARAHTVEARRALLAEFEAALAAGETGAIEAAAARFRAAWAAAPRAPRESVGELENKARELEQRAHERVDAVKRDRRAARFTVMMQKAALAARLEEAALAGGANDEAAVQAKAEFEALPKLAADVDKALAQRLAAAPGARAETLAQGRERRDALLLDLEMALDLPSPDALAELRRNRQLANLQSHFSAGTSAPVPEKLVTQWYATPAPADPEQERRIAAVVERLLTLAAAAEKPAAPKRPRPQQERPQAAG
jgi:hypothetical protein